MRKFIITWLLTSSLWPMNNLPACLWGTFQKISLSNHLFSIPVQPGGATRSSGNAERPLLKHVSCEIRCFWSWLFLYNNTSLLISPLRPERVGVPPHTAAGQPYGNAGQRGETHYEENPCSLSSFEAKLSRDPIITLNPYNKEQTRQVNLIQSNLFDYGELGQWKLKPCLKHKFHCIREKVLTKSLRDDPDGCRRT